MADELQRVRRARRRLDAAEVEYSDAIDAALAAGHQQTVVARYAGVTKQAIQKRQPRKQTP